MDRYGYDPICNEYTDEIINDTRDFLEKTNKSQVTIDTLDLCHFIGKIDALNSKIRQLERQILIKDKYCENIWMLGFDYDGFEKPESLKGLIDELVEDATRAVKNDDTSVVYTEGVGGKEFNILMEEIGGDKK